jgi:microcompartment protein CcmK/EutM
MRLGHVIGRVTLHLHDPALAGSRWLVVSPMTGPQLADAPRVPLNPLPNLVVYDNLGARTGDVIGFVEGGEATAPFPSPTPVDAYNFAIIDHIDYHPPQI